MSINTKEIQKVFKRAKNYFEQHEIAYVLSYADIKEKFPVHARATNLANIDAIIMLANTLYAVVEKSYSKEMVDAFNSLLSKSIDEFRSIESHRQLSKLELGGRA